nr:MAG TPA: Chromatin remodeling complex ATPase [Herelleviridae sp.]
MVMRYFYRDSAWWHIGFSYDPELVKEAKSFANSGYNPELKEWYIPVHITTSAAVQKWLADNNFREGRVYTPSRRVVEYQEPPEVITTDDVLAACKKISLKRTPRHYQAEGIAYMINHGNCINGDDCGLGKTGQAIVTVELMDVFPTLVICPASVKYNWKKEWQKWNPARTVGIVESGRNYNESVWDSDVVVINFDILGERSTDKPKAKYKELLRKYWGSCVIDEIHFLKSEKAMRTRMTKKITKPIAHIWGLTGTLTQNRPLELVQPYQILRRFVEIFGGTLEFKFRYCDAKKTMYGFDASGFSNLEELHELLRMAGYVRRQKRDVLTELPPVIEQIVDAPISNAREYHHAEDDLLNYLETIDVEKASSAANAPHLVMLNTLRTLSIVGKMAFIKSYIQEWLESNEEKQLAVFGVHREPLQELADHFKAPVIQGGVSIENKQRIVDAFAARKHRLLFANIQSAGTGTDGLQTHCSDMIYIELPDRSTDVEQTNARLERMGQTSTITVTYLLSPETIDVEMKETLGGKKMLTDIVNAGHSENELIAMKFFRNRRRNS